MKPEFYRKVLKNGLTVLFEKRDNPVVSVSIAIRCGGINEDLSEKGISHFIEHLLYKGTEKRNAKQIAEQIEKNGGDLNGFTDETLTAYHCKMPSKHLDIAFEVLADMIKNPLFNADEMEKERQVIIEEIKMHQDNPQRYVLEQVHCSLYSGTLGSPLIGTEKTLESLTRDKILKRFKEIYVPSNMIICVVGNADFKKILSFAEKNFQNEKGRVPKYKIVKKTGSKTEFRRGIDQANFALAFHVPTARDRKNYAALVLNVLMAGGMSSRLFQEIREKRNLAYAVRGHSDINKDFAYNVIFVGAKKENVQKCKKLILEEFKKVSKSLTQKELEEIKEQIIGNHYISMEDSQNQMVDLLSNEITGNAKELYEFEKKIRDVKLKDVRDIARVKKYSFFCLLPK